MSTLASRKPEQPDDATIALQIMDGDEAGLRTLLAIHGPKAMGVLKRTFTDQIPPDELEAVLWTAAYKAWKGIGTYDDQKAALGTWFIAIAKNAAVDYLRQRPIEESAPFEDPAEFADPWTRNPSEEEAPKQKKLRKALDDVIARLPRLQREVMLADLASDGTADSHLLAARLESTVPAIQSARSKARKTLRSELTPLGCAPVEGVSDGR